MFTFSRNPEAEKKNQETMHKQFKDVNQRLCAIFINNVAEIREERI